MRLQAHEEKHGKNVLVSISDDESSFVEDKIYEFESEESVGSLKSAMGKAYNKVDNKRLSLAIGFEIFDRVKEHLGVRDGGQNWH